MRILFLFFALITTSVMSQEIHKVILPDEVREEILESSIDPDIKNLQWNRWTSNKFVVCSIDDKQAQYLVANLENIKKWLYERWGFENYPFPTECRLICVNDPVLFEKFFQMKHSKVEVRYNENEEPELMVIFFLLDKPPSAVITTPLTELCIATIDSKFNIKTPPFLKKGMAKLNASIPSIKSSFKEIDDLVESNESLYFSEGLLEINQEQYDKMDMENKLKFDNASMAFTLFLRKNYGQKKFLQFFQLCGTKENKDALNKIYGFKNYEEADSLYKAYITKMLSNLRQDKLTDAEVQIN